MRAHKANIDCEIFSVYKLWLFLVLDSEMLKPLEVVLYQRCLLQVELISCKASAMLFLRQKPYSMQNHCEIFERMFQNIVLSVANNCLLHMTGIKTSPPLSLFFVYT